MFGNTRLFTVACLTTCLITAPWSSAFAGERETLPNEAQSPALGNGKIWRSALALAPTLSLSQSDSRVYRQSVATTTDNKLVLGTLAGAAVVAGIGMLTYGTTATCKGRMGTGACDRTAVIGAIALSGGVMTLVVWALSK